MDRKEELEMLILFLSKKIYKESKSAHNNIKNCYNHTKDLIAKHRNFNKLRDNLDNAIKEYESINK